jgi:hypothetical protein
MRKSSCKSRHVPDFVGLRIVVKRGGELALVLRGFTHEHSLAHVLGRALEFFGVVRNGFEIPFYPTVND